MAGPGDLAYNATTEHAVRRLAVRQLDLRHPQRRAYVARPGERQTPVSDPTNLHAPIGLILAPNGNLIVANSDAFNVDTAQPSELVEYTQNGFRRPALSVDPANGGAFGLAIDNGTLAAVDDNIPALEEYTFPT